MADENQKKKKNKYIYKTVFVYSFLTLRNKNTK